MADDHSYVSRTKIRSASICATSLDIIPPVSVTSNDTTPKIRRRRPAARSQSARSNNNRSIKKRTALASVNQQDAKVHCNSEPKLTDQSDSTPDLSTTVKKVPSRRGTSVYHRKTTALLDVPKYQSSREQDENEDSYRLRSFSFTSKGIINRGDSFRRRRSRSNSLCPPALLTGNETFSTLLTEPEHNIPISSYNVALLGAQGVGKSALIHQFMTSECINAYDRQKDSLGSQTVSIMLNGEESELTFHNLPGAKELDKSQLPDAFVILYSVVDKNSFLKVESELSILQDANLLRTRPAIIVANKIDLARSRAVSSQDGKCLACTFRAKFIEISVGINHNVDELLVGILTQIRLKQENGDENGRQHQWHKSRSVMKASMKARQMFTWLFGKEDSKFKNCENLQIL